MGSSLTSGCGWEAFLSLVYTLMAAYPGLRSVCTDAPGRSASLERPFSFFSA